VLDGKRLLAGGYGRLDHPVGKINRVKDLASGSGSGSSPADLWAKREQKRPSVAQTGSLISGVADRYARSLYDLASGTGAVAEAERDLDRLNAMIADSEDLRRLIGSPVFSAEDQLRAVGAVLDKAKIGGLVGNFVRVVARNRRLFALPGMISAFALIAAEARGEVTANVVSAHALDASQQRDLKAALKDVVGKDVTLDIKVDPSILGGLVVRIGSRQIDTSLKTKLNSLKLALKEVG
jgi:F-type H+-transporting ATPase subunit delta